MKKSLSTAIVFAIVMVLCGGIYWTGGGEFERGGGLAALLTVGSLFSFIAASIITEEW